MHSKTWHAEVFISEDEDVTHARVLLSGDAQRLVEGVGTARRSPRDRNVPEIGDELATSRALSDLAHRLLDLAARDIETFEGGPVHLLR
jgi:hypothetical protein